MALSAHSHTLITGNILLLCDGARIRIKFNKLMLFDVTRLMIYFVPIISALITLLSLAYALSSSYSKKILDIPNERSLHSVSIPRIGGIGLMAGLASSWILLADALAWWLVLPLLILFVVSLLDDMHGLSVYQRLLAHLVASAILISASGFFTEHGIVVAFAVLLFTVWVTNLYNFMDGSDGLAGGMALIGFSAYGIAAVSAHHTGIAVLNLSVAAAALGFLAHNFPPAKVFMGDAGSIPLGFLVSAMGLLGWQMGCWSVWFPLLVFSPFLVDASVTLLKRSLRGARITEAHREHYYQRAIQMGRSHRTVALFEYVLMLASGVWALLLLEMLAFWVSLLIWGGIYGALMLSIDSAWKKFEQGEHA